jgi:hypothetical protein
LGNRTPDLRITSRKQEAQDVAVSPDHCPPRVHWSTGDRSLGCSIGCSASLGLPLRRPLYPEARSVSRRDRELSVNSVRRCAPERTGRRPRSHSVGHSALGTPKKAAQSSSGAASGRTNSFGKPVCPLVMWRLRSQTWPFEAGLAAFLEESGPVGGPSWAASSSAMRVLAS